MSLTRSLTQPLVRPLTRAITEAGVGGPILLSPPSGFDWTPPVNVYRSASGVYSTDFNADDWIIPGATAIYVSTTGNNTTGDGTQGNPYAGIDKALEVAAAGADVPYSIFVAAGMYSLGNSFNNQACDRDLNIIATGGRAVCNGKFPISTAWTNAGSGMYSVTRSGVASVLDYRYPVTWPNGDETPEKLASVASSAACQATASSWYTDGTTLYVHLQDGRSPDANTGGDVAVMTSSTAGLLFSHGRTLFVQGFDIHAPGSVGIRARNNIAANAIPQVVIDDCTVAYFGGNLQRAITLDGVTVGIVNNCRVFDSEGDGIGYSQISLGNPSCNAVEIDCYVYGAGRAATHTSVQNGSTNHANGRTVRVNNVYRNSYGPLVADINTTQNWCLGVDAQDCLLTSNDSQDSCFQAGTATGSTAKTWLDGCVTGGAFYDLYAGTGCQILYKNMAAPASVGGAGTIGTY